MNTSTSLAELRQKSVPVEIGFTTSAGFEGLQRIANMFAQSTLVPKAFQGNVANCCIAVEMAVRMAISPLMCIQNLYIVHGTPSWSASFLISCFNQCGRFTPISYKFEGNPNTDEWGCRAVSTYASTGEQIEGTLVTIGMAKKEGWYSKNGSKWQTMPEQMLRYRAAAWMIRATAPEIGMGFHTREELHDIELRPDESGTYTITSDSIEQKSVDTETMPYQTEEEPVPLPKPEMITSAQRKAIMAYFGDTERDVRISHMCEQIGRQITSFSELTKDEASKFIDSTQRSDLHA